MIEGSIGRMSVTYHRDMGYGEPGIRIKVRIDGPDGRRYSTIARSLPADQFEAGFETVLARLAAKLKTHLVQEEAKACDSR